MKELKFHGLESTNKYFNFFKDLNLKLCEKEWFTSGNITYFSEVKEFLISINFKDNTDIGYSIKEHDIQKETPESIIKKLFNLKKDSSN